MTDGAASGAEDTGNNQAGGTPENGGAPGNSSPSATTPPASGSEGTNVTALLNEDNRNYFEGKGWKGDSLDPIVGSYRELERNYTQLTQERGEVPQDPKGYEFKLPDGLPEEGFYNSDFAGKFANWAKEANLSKKQAQVLHDKYATEIYGDYTNSQKTQSEQFEQSVKDAHDGLVKEWGPQDRPVFQQNIEMANRAIANLDPDLKSALKQSGVIVDVKDEEKGTQEVVTNHAIVRALAKVGRTMFQEDDLYGSQQNGVNPFDPKSTVPNRQTAQAKVIKENPELAETLIKAANVQEDFQFFLQRRAQQKNPTSPVRSM